MILPNVLLCWKNTVLWFYLEPFQRLLYSLLSFLKIMALCLSLKSLCLTSQQTPQTNKQYSVVLVFARLLANEDKSIIWNQGVLSVL